MNTPTTRSFRPARVVALVLIALATVALAYVRFAPGESDVSVPPGAKAGQLTLEPCEYATEAGSLAADCGTLVVPENHAEPGSRLIALPVTRIRATSAEPAEPIFRLEGGPGLTNMEFEKASRLVADHDVVLVGYRGVDGSVRLDCPEVDSAARRATDLLDEKSFRAYAEGFRACADRLTDEGVDVTAYGLPQQVEDMEAARRALGYDRIDLLSESAGTRTALIYAWRYPESIHRSVMIGANPPGHYLWDERTTDEQIARYAELCAADESCGERTDDLAASIERTSADMPESWLGLPIDAGNVQVFSFYGLMESTSEAAPLSAPATLDAWLAVEDGDASGFWLQSVFADLFPMPFVWGQYAAAARLDAQAAREYFAAGEDETSLARAATAFAWGGGTLADAWPPAPDETRYSRMRASSVETLLVNGELDGATPPQVAKRLLPYLPNGRQVVLPGLGHTIDFWSRQPEASTRLLTGFFDGGKVDDSLYEPTKVDFTPAMTLTTMAKIAAGAMVGLAGIALLSLLWMPLHVRSRGGFGRSSSAVLRSVYPVVLGLGGWFAGLLVAMTAMPSVPLGDELLAVLSVGVPIGLGIHWASVRRDHPADTRFAGLVAAAAGALVGAWLGFNAASDMMALLTTIVGATAGANLTVIVLDVARERSARQAETTSGTTSRLEPSAPSAHGRA